MEDAIRAFMIVGAVVRHVETGRIALVRQPLGGDSGVWTLPAGKIEKNESLSDALVREIREETGLRLTALTRLAYAVHYVLPVSLEQTSVFIFDVEAEGDIGSRDPDDDIEVAEWFDQGQVLDRLAAQKHAVMRDPAIAYLTGERPAGTMWSYGTDEGEFVLAAVISPEPS